jgi:opacity protein-like surface antigen
MRRASLLCAILLLLFFTASALAMSSANYRLDWFTPLNTGGGGGASSANYRAEVTIGQTAIGEASSTSYGTGLGFWYGLLDWGRVYLPLVLRNYP